MGELVEGELYYRAECRELEKYSGMTSGRTALFTVPSAEISKAAGQKRRNTVRLINNFGLSGVKFRGDGWHSLNIAAAFLLSEITGDKKRFL